MWAAVSGRDARFDGRFVYAVISTGIYCRPSCGARLPRRDRVRFFRGPAEAEASGFRPCKRCRPDVDEQARHGLKLVAAAAYIEAHRDERVTLETHATQVGLSSSHLQRAFTRAYGLSPYRYQAQLRGEEMRRRLRSGDTVAAAGYGAGFGSSRAVYEEAKRSMGMTPAAYRRGGAGLDIHYGMAPSVLGVVLVGATDRGVCCVILGDSDESVARGLTDEFPHAALHRDDAGVAQWMVEVVARIGGERPSAQVPLDLCGTDFQRRVWTALREVPSGSTVSYQSIAVEIGRPAATRAVAGACAGNHVAVLVPCHRVVRSDGGLAGYRWGVDRKRALLEGERRAEGASQG
jgi:AraC family transcriptional regulator of adaptative response/methylated-DNA-[protein]-cysteine methyltransferase